MRNIMEYTEQFYQEKLQRMFREVGISQQVVKAFDRSSMF